MNVAASAPGSRHAEPLLPRTHLAALTTGAFPRHNKGRPRSSARLGSGVAPIDSLVERVWIDREVVRYRRPGGRRRLIPGGSPGTRKYLALIGCSLAAHRTDPARAFARRRGDRAALR
jgi:hypothetical protein